MLITSCSGHGSFSNDLRLNSVAGHLLHSSILVPYHGWLVLLPYLSLSLSLSEMNLLQNLTFFRLYLVGELAIELTTRTMGMLRMTNLGTL